MIFSYRNIFRFLVVALLLLGGMLSAAHAEEDDDDDIQAVAATNAKWQTECGACHVAFSPRLLPAASWRAMMSGLDKHFGTDASLDAPTAREIGAFLDKQSGGGKHSSSGKPVLRITDTGWFKREHDEVPARVWKDPKVKSPSNCAACHLQAERGNYSERNIRIPR